jgi:hypothetical protein
MPSATAPATASAESSLPLNAVHLYDIPLTKLLSAPMLQRHMHTHGSQCPSALSQPSSKSDGDSAPLSGDPQWPKVVDYLCRMGKVRPVCSILMCC